MRTVKSSNTKSTAQTALGSDSSRKLIPISQAIFIVLAFGLLAASVAMFFLETDITHPFFERPFNVYRIVIMSLAVICLLLATKTSWYSSADSGFADDKYKGKLLRRLGYIVPALAVVFMVLQLAFPDFAAVLVRKESWPFYRNAIFVKSFMQLIGLIAFVGTATHYAKRRKPLATALSILTALVLLVMIGEELSWGQRIFGWATPDSIAAINKQGETNLHNMATQTFQNVLYFGGWLLLVALPFWHNTLTGIIKKVKSLQFLEAWLPPVSFVLIFAVGFGFGDPLHSETGLYYGSNLFIALATPIILVGLLTKFIHARDNSGACRTAVILAIYLFILICNQFFSTLWDANSGAVTEYLELFISLGIMTWAIVVNKRTKLVTHSAKSRKKVTAKAPPQSA